MKLADRVAVVTGGSRGIGRATAELFAEEGAQVIVADLTLERPFPNARTQFVQHDVTDETSWHQLVDLVETKFGQLNVLFNNAGVVGSYEPIDTITVADWNRVLGVNLQGVFLGCRSAIPLMKSRGGGSIINTSSIWGIAGASGVAAYTASKGAVRLLSKNVALSYVGDGIRCNSLHPGIVDTPLIAVQDEDITAAVVDQTPMKRLGTPREIAQAALFLASDDSSYMTGAELVVDGGYTAQ